MDSDPAAYYYLGMCYKELKRYDDAIKELSISAKLQQNDFLAEVRTQIAASYYAQKNYSEALKYYQDAFRENPDNKKLIFYIAAVYDHYYKDKTIAIKYYQKYLTLGKDKDKKLVSYAMDRINALVEKNHFQKAAKSN
jgi:tetratricopeptide (TPR) repeat protein